MEIEKTVDVLSIDGVSHIVHTALLTAGIEDAIYADRCRQACVCLSEVDGKVIRTAVLTASTKAELNRRLCLLTGEPWQPQRSRPKSR